MPTKCHNCDVRNPHVADFVVGGKSAFTPPEEPAGMVFSKIKELDSKSPSERWAFWIGEFSRCIKCYACRQGCSLCYCERCITEKNMPPWVKAFGDPRCSVSGNLMAARHPVG